MKTINHKTFKRNKKSYLLESITDEEKIEGLETLMSNGTELLKKYREVVSQSRLLGVSINFDTSEVLNNIVELINSTSEELESYDYGNEFNESRKNTIYRLRELIKPKG